MTSPHTFIFMFIALSLVAAPAAADCCHHGHHDSGYNCDHDYDHDHELESNCPRCRSNGPIATLQTMEGKITAIEYVPGATPDAAMVEVFLQSAAQTRRIRLAPVRYLKESAMVLKEGDSIAVKGFPVAGMDGDFLAVVEVRKGDETLSLRDFRGRPSW